MPTTSPDGYPYPVLTDTADVPRDIKALADRVQALRASDAAWTAYVPSFTRAADGAVLSPGAGGSVTGRYRRVGANVQWQATLVIGSSPNLGGSGAAWVFSLPFTADRLQQAQGTAGVLIGSGSTLVPAVSHLWSTTLAGLNLLVGGTRVGADSHPWSASQGCYLGGSFVAAS